MSTWNSTQFNRIPWNAPGPDAVIVMSACVTVTMTLECEVALTFLTCTGENEMVVGSRPIIQAVFSDPSDQSPLTPTTITFSMQDPTGVITDYVYGVSSIVTNPSSGTYLFKPTMTIPGTYVLNTAGSGAVLGADKTVWRVDSKY